GTHGFRGVENLGAAALLLFLPAFGDIAHGAESLRSPVTRCQRLNRCLGLQSIGRRAPVARAPWSNGLVHSPSRTADSSRFHENRMRVPNPIALILIAASLLVASRAPAAPLTFTDDVGRQVTLPHVPQKIVS